MIILVDVDDVCCDLVTPWIEVYNADYGDNLTRESITDWDLLKFVKPECGDKIYDYLRMDNLDLYYAAIPIPGALSAVNYLRERGNKIVYVTAFDWKDRKFKWLKDNNFWNYADSKVITKDKYLISGDLLIDDSYNNVITFTSGESWIFTAPWNKKYEFVHKVNSRNKFFVKRVDNWEDVVKAFNSRYYEE